MSPYRKGFDNTKYMSFLIKDNELLKKYNEIWEEVKNSIKKELDSEPAYNEKILKDKKCLKMGTSTQTFTTIKYQKKTYIYLLEIFIDSIFINS